MALTVSPVNDRVFFISPAAAVINPSMRGSPRRTTRFLRSFELDSATGEASRAISTGLRCLRKIGRGSPIGPRSKRGGR